MSPSDDAEAAVTLPVKRLHEERKKKRIAQKLYRVRKKDELQDLENQLAQVTQKVENLTVENQTLRQKVRVLSEIITCRDTFIACLSKVVCQTSQPTNASAMDPSLPRPHVTLTDIGPFQFHNVSAEEVALQYKAFLSELSVVMLGCDETSSNKDLIQKIEKLYREKLSMVRGVFLRDQLCFLQVISFNLELWKPVPAGDEHWATVVEAVNFSDQQKLDLVDAFGVCCKFMEKLHPPRQQLLDKVLQMCESLSDVSSSLSSSALLLDITHYQCLEHMEKLDQVIKQEIDVTVLMWSFLHNSLSVVQRARLAIQSYPFIPDAFSIMHVLWQHTRGKAVVMPLDSSGIATSVRGVASQLG